MNAQPEPIMSQVLMVIFMIIGAYSFFTYKPRKTKSNLDYFELGYISENVEEIHHYIPNTYQAKKLKATKKKTKVQPVKQTIKKPKPPRVKTKPVKKQISPLQQDCISALRSMGMTKSEATEKANYIFKSSQPGTIQEFIMEAFKRERN